MISARLHMFQSDSTFFLIRFHIFFSFKDIFKKDENYLPRFELIWFYEKTFVYFTKLRVESLKELS